MSYWVNMEERVNSYLQARRSVGYLLRIEGEQLLRFAGFADQRRSLRPYNTRSGCGLGN